MANLERTVSVTMKVTADEAKAFKEAASAESMSVSEYVRAATLMYMAMTGHKFALRLLARGALRVSADLGRVVVEWCTTKGYLSEVSRAAR